MSPRAASARRFGAFEPPAIGRAACAALLPLKPHDESVCFLHHRGWEPRAQYGLEQTLTLLHTNGHFLVVDEKGSVQAIIAASDAIAFFNVVASPFILIQESELALRGLMRRAVSEKELAECALVALTQQFAPTGHPVPQLLEDMDLGNYLSIIRDTRNWPKFAQTFGEPRLFATQNIEALRSHRNDVMHFKGSISAEQYEELADCRNWLHLRMTICGFIR